MRIPTRSRPADPASLHHLQQNAAECARTNIVVRVDTISHVHHAVFCSVEQRLRGGLWHTCSVEELTWLAEQALSPLIGMGYVPLITVRHKDLRNAQASLPPLRAFDARAWIARLRAWLGRPDGREGFDATATARDPFGWFAALQRATPQVP
jgi:hypothetical protein